MTTEVTRDEMMTGGRVAEIEDAKADDAIEFDAKWGMVNLPQERTSDWSLAIYENGSGMHGYLRRHYSEPDADCISLPPISTRGQFRALCKGLGIVLKEGE